ncbi:6575_t:CDS:1, partial [Cetraspora pellucida]
LKFENINSFSNATSRLALGLLERSNDGEILKMLWSIESSV